VTDDVPRRRRESDRAYERALRAEERGDRAAYLVATRQAEDALRRRAEWALAHRPAGSPPAG
jgi:hypothetical protein